MKTVRESARYITGITALTMSSIMENESKQDLEEILKGMEWYSEIVYAVVLDNRHEVFSSYNQESAIKAEYEIASTGNPLSRDGLVFRTSEAIVYKDKQPGRLFLGISLESLKLRVQHYKHTIILVSVIIFLFGVLVIFFVSTVITNPLKKMVRTIDEISSGDLSRRVPYSSRDGVGNLAAAFNSMVDHLQSYSAKLRQLNVNLENMVAERTIKLQAVVDEREEAQQALEKSEKKYRSLVDNSLVGIYIIRNHVLNFCNQKFAEIFGYRSPDALMGRHMRELVTEESWEIMDRAARIREPGGRATRAYELKGIKKDGTVFDIEVLDNPIDFKGEPAFEGILIDITIRKRVEEERQRLEEQLRQSQKMESIGTLAGGIAHDFNNILSAIIGYTELSLGSVAGGSKVKSNLERVLTAGNRAKELVKQILAFSRKGEEERKPIWLNEVVSEALKLIRSTLPATIEIRLEIPEMQNPVMANMSEIHQVVMNLCTNAGHAMRKNGGLLTVTLKEIELGTETIGQKNLLPGLYQQLTIKDTGHGMAPEIVERIFEPYYTTKKEGEGTGLGLAVVHGIVISYGGDIAVYSKPGKGTTFHVFLPVVEHGKVEIDAHLIEPVRGGDERVLFVDDEPLLAELGSSMLEKLGYNVVMRTSSIEAFEAFSQNPDRFDLVITDQTMPNMTGIKLAKKIRKIKPGIPIILCSGFSETINEENFRSFGIDAYLMKPITRYDLARVLRQVLDSR